MKTKNSDDSPRYSDTFAFDLCRSIRAVRQKTKLTIPAALTLYLISRRDWIGNELAGALHSVPNNVHAITTRLRKLGYVTYLPHEKKKNVKYLHITPAGKQALRGSEIYDY